MGPMLHHIARPALFVVQWACESLPDFYGRTPAEVVEHNVQSCFGSTEATRHCPWKYQGTKEGTARCLYSERKLRNPRPNRDRERHGHPVGTKPLGKGRVGLKEKLPPGQGCAAEDLQLHVRPRIFKNKSNFLKGASQNQRRHDGSFCILQLAKASLAERSPPTHPGQLE